MRFSWIFILASFGACAGGRTTQHTDDGDGDADSDTDTGTGTGAGTDSDVDIDGDVDSDSDSDTGSDSGSDSDTGTGTGPDVPNAVGMDAICSGRDLSSHVADEWTEPELHVIGVYEASSDHAIVADASVFVDRGYEMILVLSSYEAVHWTVTTADDTTLTEVIVNGYEDSSADVPEGTFLTNDSGLGRYLTACAYAWPGDAGGCDTATLVSRVEDLTDLELTSFHGCYQGNDFTLTEE